MLGSLLDRKEIAKEFDKYYYDVVQRMLGVMQEAKVIYNQRMEVRNY